MAALARCGGAASGGRHLKTPGQVGPALPHHMATHGPNELNGFVHVVLLLLHVVLDIVILDCKNLYYGALI